MTVFHCEYAWLGGSSVTKDVLVTVKGDRIESVSSEVPASPGSVRLSGVTLPGFANAHSHAFHRALRGTTQHGNGSFWTWREQMYRLAEVLDPDSYYRLARAVYGEMVLAGVSCVGEFHYLHHDRDGRSYADPNAMTAALLAAADEAGLRITLLDTCYLRGDIGVAPNPIQRRFSDGHVENWAARVSAALVLASPRTRIAAAVHSVRAVEPDDIERVTAWVSTNDTVVHAHVSEQPAENRRCLDTYALTPTELLSERGLLTQRFTAVHATHLTDHDIRLLGSSGSTVCMCPTTERDLADGIGPTVRLREAGSPLSLGSDSHAVIDMFEEARAVELNERLAGGLRGNHSTEVLLDAATLDGHRCLGWFDAGMIRAGAKADLVTVSLDSVRLAGTSSDSALDAVVFAGAPADVRHVMIDGRVVVQDGSHLRIDVAGELASSIESLRGDG